MSECLKCTCRDCFHNDLCCDGCRICAGAYEGKCNKKQKRSMKDEKDER